MTALLTILLTLALATGATETETEKGSLDPLDHWMQWRGPLGTGFAPRAQPPTTWSEKKNVRWKLPVPGVGHSTPVIVGDRIFLTTAVAHGEAREHWGHEAHGAHDNHPPLRRLKHIVLCYSRGGVELWRKELRDAFPHDSAHTSGSWASPSPVADGEHLVVSFGSQGLYGLDHDGKLVWESDLGDMAVKHGHGEGSSPALAGETVIVNWDHEGKSFVTALDKRTGQERWRKVRNEGTSWSTPFILERDGKRHAIVSATNRVRAYDVATGAVIWECGGLSNNVVASPVADQAMVYVACSYDFQALLAIRLAEARGDITGGKAVAWTRSRHTPYVPSPLLMGDRLYYLRHYQGLVTCLRAREGKTLYGPQRLGGIRDVYASLAGAAGKVYIVSRTGTTAVLKEGDRFELLAVNQLEDSFSASPAMVDGELYLRGEAHLYCLAE